MIQLFNELLAGVQASDPRWQVINHEHIQDTKTGIEYHLYPDRFKLTLNGTEIPMCIFGDDVHHVMTRLKTMLTAHYKPVYLKMLSEVSGMDLNAYSSAKPHYRS